MFHVKIEAQLDVRQGLEKLVARRCCSQQPHVHYLSTSIHISLTCTLMNDDVGTTVRPTVPVEPTACCRDHVDCEGFTCIESYLIARLRGKQGNHRLRTCMLVDWP